ncbi:MAG TPA: hypothetical protein VNK52_03215 [Hyphomicrobiaceae bacterium]|nr:hypothetical protein [Hyphomicrobiaceae bacterium]
MARRILFATSAVLAVAAATGVVAQMPTFFPGRRTALIEGRVTDVFGNSFVVEHDGERVLVETGPEWHRRVEVGVGERIKAVGRRDDDVFEAFRILHEDGREVTIRTPDGPPPWAGGPSRMPR